MDCFKPHYFQVPGSCTLPHANFLVSGLASSPILLLTTSLMAPHYLQNPIQPQEQNLYTLRI